MMCPECREDLEEYGIGEPGEQQCTACGWCERTAKAVRLIRVMETKSGPVMYQTEPVQWSGVGRFQVYKTDNANARTVGRLPKWTVRDLYKPLSMFPVRCDTLDEVREYIARVLKREESHARA